MLICLEDNINDYDMVILIWQRDQLAIKGVEKISDYKLTLVTEIS